MWLNLQQEEELSEEVRKYPAIYDKSRIVNKRKYINGRSKQTTILTIQDIPVQWPWKHFLACLKLDLH